MPLPVIIDIDLAISRGLYRELARRLAMPTLARAHFGTRFGTHRAARDRSQATTGERCALAEMQSCRDLVECKIQIYASRRSATPSQTPRRQRILSASVAIDKFADSLFGDRSKQVTQSAAIVRIDLIDGLGAAASASARVAQSALTSHSDRVVCPPSTCTSTPRRQTNGDRVSPDFRLRTSAQRPVAAPL